MNSVYLISVEILFQVSVSSFAVIYFSIFFYIVFSGWGNISDDFFYEEEDREQ